MAFFKSSTWHRTATPQSTLARCGRCGLSKQCLSPRMEATGKGRKSLLFVAEAPGAEEDKEGMQLIGEAGETLRDALHAIGEELDDATKTNSVICRPPNNKMEDVYIESCRPNLLRTIKEIQPTVIVLLGASAVKSVISTEWKKDLGELARWVGWKIPSPTFNAWVCPTYHPSYINRMKKDKVLLRMLKDHLKAAYRLEQAGRPMLYENLQGLVEVTRGVRACKLRLRDLNTKSGLLAFDYETNSLKPDDVRSKLFSVSFCLGGKDTWACRLTPELFPYLSEVLQNRKLKKIASNIKFEERWTRAKLGHGVAGWDWDTMQAAHVLDNRSGICSVKFQAYILLGVPDYDGHIAPYLKSSGKSPFNRIEEADENEVLVYNGMDSLLEYMVTERQKELMGL